MGVAFIKRRCEPSCQLVLALQARVTNSVRDCKIRLQEFRRTAGRNTTKPTHTQGVAMADDVVEEGLARAVVPGEDHVLVTAFAFNLHKRNGE